MNYAVILAAGSSSRFGDAKWRVEIDGERLLDRAIETASSADLEPIIVQGCYPLDVAGDVVDNPEWESGMGTSIAVGTLRARELGAERVVIMTVDQIDVTSEDLRRLLEHANPISAAQYEGGLGVPACFSKSEFDLLEALVSQGARSILRSRDDVHPVSMPNAARDVDRPEDLP